jgi:hypothetical protein
LIPRVNGFSGTLFDRLFLIPAVFSLSVSAHDHDPFKDGYSSADCQAAQATAQESSITILQGGRSMFTDLSQGSL